MALTLLAPTALEYWALRAVVGQDAALRCGVAVDRDFESAPGDLAVVCGLAGSLTDDLEPGTVLIPDRVGDGMRSFTGTDGAGNEALRAAAGRLGFVPHSGCLLTAPALVTGEDRRRWAEEGFVAADMEAAILARRDLRIATVRVILDTPSHSIDSAWLNPGTAWRRPDLWPQLLWLAGAAPRYALRAARIAAGALSDLEAAV